MHTWFISAGLSPRRSQMTFEPGTPKLGIGGSSIKSRYVALHIAATRFLKAHWALLAPIITLLARPVRFGECFLASSVGRSSRTPLAAHVTCGCLCNADVHDGPSPGWGTVAIFITEAFGDLYLALRDECIFADYSEPRLRDESLLDFLIDGGEIPLPDLTVDALLQRFPSAEYLPSHSTGATTPGSGTQSTQQARGDGHKLPRFRMSSQAYPLYPGRTLHVQSCSRS